VRRECEIHCSESLFPEFIENNAIFFPRPILALGQHYFFKHPFSRKPLDEDEDLFSDDENATNEGRGPNPGRSFEASNDRVINVNQKGERPVSGSTFGFSNTNKRDSGVGVDMRLSISHRFTNSGLWDPFRRK